MNKVEGDVRPNVFIIKCKNCNRIIAPLWARIPDTDRELYCDCGKPILGKIELIKANLTK